MKKLTIQLFGAVALTTSLSAIAGPDFQTMQRAILPGQQASAHTAVTQAEPSGRPCAAALTDEQRTKRMRSALIRSGSIGEKSNTAAGACDPALQRTGMHDAPAADHACASQTMNSQADRRLRAPTGSSAQTACNNQ